MSSGAITAVFTYDERALRSTDAIVTPYTAERLLQDALVRAIEEIADKHDVGVVVHYEDLTSS